MRATTVSDTFDAARWDALRPGTAVQGGRWLSTMLSRLPGRPVTAVHAGPDGARGAVGFVGAVVEDPEAYEAYNPWLILRGPEPVFKEVYASGRQVAPQLGAAPERMLPGLVLTAPGYLGDPVGPAAGRPEEVLACLAGVCAWARSAGLATVTVLYTTPAAASTVEPAVAALGGESFDLTTRSVREVTWTDAEGFRQAIGRRRRAEMKRQLNRLAELGAEVGQGDPEARFEEVIEARCELVRRYGQPVDEAGERRRLRTLIDTFGPDLRLYTTERAGRIVAHSLFLAQNRTLQNIYTGTTEQGRDTPFAPLAATYHAPMSSASSERLDRIDYGIGHGSTKRLQGCRAIPLRGHLIPLS
ncbi:GNAT family N-acetyltransferase [Kitasatospora sp. NPDC050543]|uniref:GNAT family N-acetyltransferase n=1 Tax=Kitasatospora sp. NPDC050543 TaxID=3364054 RepID=UPI0037A4C838